MGTVPDPFRVALGVDRLGRPERVQLRLARIATSVRPLAGGLGRAHRHARAVSCDVRGGHPARLGLDDGALAPSDRRRRSSRLGLRYVVHALMPPAC